MANLAHRRNAIFDQTQGDLRSKVGAYVHVLKPGGTVVSYTQGTVTILGVPVRYTDITLQAGHGFAAEDRLIIGTDTSAFGAVQSLPSTNVIRVYAQLAPATGEVVVNLGADTGSTSPNWDGADIPIYSTSDGSGSALSPSRVTTSEEGEYEYWTANRRLWEVPRTTAGVVLDIVQDPLQSLEGKLQYNVKDYGALGDASNDDTAEIQAAIDAAELTGGEVIFPVGTYHITDRLTVNGNNITLRGVGGASVVKMTTNNKICLLVGAIGTTYKNFYLSDMVFDNNDLGEADLGVVTLYDTNGFVIERCEVKNSVDGCNGISVSQDTSRGVIRDCHIHDTGKAAIYSAGATTGQGVDGMVIDGNIVHDVTHASSTVPGIQVIGGLYTRVVNNIVYSCEQGIACITGGNYVSSTNEYDVPLDVLIHGNVVRNCSDIAISLAADASYVGDDSAQNTRAIVANNHCKANTADGIKVANRNNVVLTGNYCEGNANGIFLTGCDYVSVLGNFCNNNTTAGFLFRGSTDLVIKGNQGHVYDGGTQGTGILFDSTVCDKVQLIGNDVNGSTAPITFTTTPTNLTCLLNRPKTQDFIPSGTAVGAANTSPDGILHIRAASAGTVTANTVADELVIEGSADAGLSILAGNANLAAIYFGDDGDNGIGRIVYDHSTNRLVFRTSGTDRFYMGATGEFWIPDGITAPSATVGSAKLFVDTADGDLKIIFGDGTTKTIVVDT